MRCETFRSHAANTHVVDDNVDLASTDGLGRETVQGLLGLAHAGVLEDTTKQGIGNQYRSRPFKQTIRD